MVDSIPSSRSLIKISHLYEKILSPKEAFLLKQNNNYGNLQRSFLTESNSKNLLDSTTCIRCSQTVMERAWTCTVFSQVFLWHRTCVESDKSQGEGDGKWSLFFFLHPWEICAREHPLFPIYTCLWQKPAVLSRICTVWFYPMTSKFVFVDKLVGRAQLVRKWVVLISSLFMSVI